MYLRYFGKFIYLYDLPYKYTKKLNFISKCDVTDIKLAKIDCHFSMFYVKSRRKKRLRVQEIYENIFMLIFCLGN